MDAAAAALKRRSGRHIPIEITEEILLNLPVKSLIRFSSVSRSWNSMVFEPGFIRKHKDRAALLRRHRIIISAVNSNLMKRSSSCSCFCDIYSISSDFPIDKEIKLRRTGDTFLPEDPTVIAADTVGRFHRETYLLAHCDELWCVEVNKALFLWNPSLRNYRRIPKPQFSRPEIVIFALGYDSVSDDYKLLKLPHDDERPEETETEVYSLKSNCWRRIESPSFIPIWSQDFCEFLNGNFHWVGYSDETSKMAIVSFDLSSEKYGIMELPETKYYISDEEDDLQVVVVRGMLCLCLNDCKEARFKIWMMEEYGNEASCTIKYDIQYGAYLSHSNKFLPRLRLLHMYDNDDLAIVASSDIDCGPLEMFLYKNKGAEAKRIARCVRHDIFTYFEAFLYVESLISVGHNEEG